MSRLLRRVRGEERGIALMVALAALLALGIAVTAVISYTTSNQHATNLSQAEQTADQVAEGGMEQAYSVINYQNTATSGTPTAANLFGCAGANGSSSDTTAPSNCSSGHVTAVTYCVSASSGCAAGSAGSASVFGCYIGPNPGSCNMNGFTVSNVPKGDWLIYSTGYARNPATNTVISKTLKATVNVTSSTNGLKAPVWNYLFSSAPAGAGCELTVNGQNVVIDVPIFVTGDLCFAGNNTGAEEDKQAVDVQVMGKTVFSGSNSFVGSSTAPITSGVSVGGCASSINNTGTSCSGFNWHVKTTDTPPSTTPIPPAPDFDTEYSSADIGPKNGCSTSGTLAKSVFDNNTTRDNSAGTFNLTPSTSYSCVSGSSQLSWNASTKKLTVAGTIYLDGNVQVTQSATYSGNASFYMSGTFSFSGQNTTLCATSPCTLTTAAWTSANSMLLLIPADMANTANAVQLNGNNNTLQAGVLAPSNVTISLGGNNVTYQGPIIGGKFTWGNNVNLMPLPPIDNLPPGAPVDPNSSVVVGALTYTS